MGFFGEYQGVTVWYPQQQQENIKRLFVGTVWVPQMHVHRRYEMFAQVHKLLLNYEVFCAFERRSGYLTFTVVT